MDETFDWIVVGSGGGSMCSALVMRSLGKSVVILEKTDLIGGSGAMCGGGLWVPAHSFHREDGGDRSPGKAPEDLERVGGGPRPGRRPPPGRRAARRGQGPT